MTILGVPGYPIEFPLSSHWVPIEFPSGRPGPWPSAAKAGRLLQPSQAWPVDDPFHSWKNWLIKLIKCRMFITKKKGTVLENIICAKVKTWNIGLRVIHYSTYWESFQCINPSSLFMTIPNMIQDWTVLIRYNCSRALRSSGVCCFKDSSECQSFDRLQLLTYDEGIV